MGAQETSTSRWRITEPPPAWSASARATLAWTCFGALVLRLVYILLKRHEPLPYNSDPYYYSLIAQHLLEGAGYIELKSRAYRPPGMVALLAVVYKLAGVNLLAARVALAAVGAATCALQAEWVRRLSSNQAGLAAAVLTAVYPQFIRYPHELYTEILFIALVAAALSLLLAALASESWPKLLVAGVVTGLAALTRETGLLLVPVAGLWFVVGRAGLPARLGRRWLVYAVGAALAVLPWTVRNYRVLHAFVPITTNTGINLYIGNNPVADGECIWMVVPGVDWADGANELEANRVGLREALRYARAHPARTLRLALVKAWIMWRPPCYGFDGLSLFVALQRLIWLLSYLGLLVLAWRARPWWGRLWPAGLLPLLLLAVMTATHMAAYGGTRYRLPLEALLLYFSGLGTLRRPSREAPPTDDGPA